MRTVVSGGEKTDNIVNAVYKRFESSGDEIITLKFIDDIHEYIDCGYKVDKFIITEQSITNEWQIEDENELRSRVNEICNAISDKMYGAEVVFLTHYEDLAAMISEESLSVSNNSGIVVKEPPYTVLFFADLIAKEVSTLSEELLYTPGDIGEYNNDDEEDEWEDGDIPESDKEDTEDGWEEQEENWEEQEESKECEEDKWEDDTDFDDSEFLDDGTDDGWDDGEESDNSIDNTEDSFGDEDFWGDDFSEEHDEIKEESSDNSNDWEEDINNTVEEVIDDIGNTISDFADELYSEESDNNDTEAEIYNEEQTKEENDKIDVVLYDEQKRVNKEVNPLPTVDSDNIQLGEEIIKGRKRLFSKKKAGVKVSNTNVGCNIGEIKDKLVPFANRGNSIVVTGCGGSGASTVAMNMANVLSGLGYNVLLVDMDTIHPSQGYITKQAYDSVMTDSKSLVSAINNSVSIEKYTSIVKPGLHLLTMWMGGDCVPIDCTVKKEKIMKFVNMVKGNYNFIIYDIPFASATTFLSDVTFACDNIVHVVDSSNWGISKFMLDMCNIEDENMQEAMFNRSEIIFNKFRGMTRLFGRNIGSFDDILSIIDDKIVDLTGGDIGLYFSNLHIVGHINDDRAFEDGWFSTTQYSDTERGRESFINLTAKAVLHV